MEDLHVHEVQQGMKVSKESSAATLGAMLPTVPPDKTIIKKEGIETMIPEELMEFIYNEDASYTYAVEGAISNMAHNVKDKFTNNEHSKDLKTNSLPFKVRQLTIERATLKVKISWMGKRKSKQEKVLKYKKRLVEVEQALRKIQNSVNNADEKKKIAQQIKELDASVTKSASAELQQRGVLESVNTFIREGKEQGFILSDVQEFTMESFYGDLGDTEFNVVTEGANYELMSTVKSSKKMINALSKKVKKAIKKENYDDAEKYLQDMKKELEDAKHDIDAFPVDKMSVNIVGMLGGLCLHTCKCLLQGFGVQISQNISNAIKQQEGFGFVQWGSALARIANTYSIVDNILLNGKQNNNKMTPSMVNGLYNKCLKSVDTMSKDIDKLTKAVNAAKKAKEKADKEALKETKESVFLLDCINESVSAVDEDGDPVFVFDEYTIDDVEFLMEGANADLGKAYLSTATALIGVARKFKKAVRKNDYDEAKSQLAYMQRHVGNLEKALKKYPKSDLKTNIIGTIVGLAMSLVRIILDTFGITSLFLTATAVVGGSLAAGTAVAIGAEKIAEAKDSIAKTLKVMNKMPSIPIPTGFSEYGGYIIGCSGAILSTISYTCASAVEIVRMMERTELRIKELGEESRNKYNDYFDRILVQFQKLRGTLKDMETAFGKMKSQKEINDFVDSVREKSSENKESEHKESVLPRLTKLNGLYESGCMDTDSYLELMTEAKKPDDGMIPILNKLHEKGYKTKYSCAGHKDSGKKDRNDDGIVNGKLASAARIMFNGDYDFPDPPKHWGFKTVEGKDYLYVLPYSNDGKDPKAFEEWKNKYMASLDRWVDSLPTAKDEKVIDKPEEDKKDKEADVKEYVEDDSVFESFVDNTLAELFMDVNNDF